MAGGLDVALGSTLHISKKLNGQFSLGRAVVRRHPYRPSGNILPTCGIECRQIETGEDISAPVGNDGLAIPSVCLRKKSDIVQWRIITEGRVTNTIAGDFQSSVA